MTEQVLVGNLMKFESDPERCDFIAREELIVKPASFA